MALYTRRIEPSPPKARAKSEARDPLVGSILDRRFKIEERIAAGGFGAIYRAKHVKSGYEVAIKILHPHMSADPRVIARFRREGVTLTQLRDPHTVTTYELAETSDGTLFIVMELLVGETLLARYRERGPMAWQQVVAIARGVCHSLAEAHSIGVVHRDLKPGNIMLAAQPDGTDRVKVLDFGIAKLLTEDGANDELTKNNEVIGTFEYISPEQIKGSSYSGRSDIYTLGVVMYETITGSRPFANVSGPALLVTILTQRPPLASERLPDIPPELDRVIAKCLEPEPEDRFGDVKELVAMFDMLVPADTEIRPPDSLDEATNFLARAPVMPAAKPKPKDVEDALRERPSQPFVPQTIAPIDDERPSQRGSRPAVPRPVADRGSQPVRTYEPAAPTIPEHVMLRAATEPPAATIPDRPVFGGAQDDEVPPAEPVFHTAQGWAPVLPASRPRAPVPTPAYPQQILHPQLAPHQPQAHAQPDAPASKLWIVILLAAIVVGVILAIAI